VQILADPTDRLSVWSSEVEPGSVHDISAARAHCLGALYKSAAHGVPTLKTRTPHGARRARLAAALNGRKSPLMKLVHPELRRRLSRLSQTAVFPRTSRTFSVLR
jgi:hypothetical protein